MFRVFRLRLLIALGAALPLSACYQDDIENLQIQIDGLKAEVSSVKSTADEALAAAQAAEAAANRAVAAAQRTEAMINEVLDRGFRKAPMR